MKWPKRATSLARFFCFVFLLLFLFYFLKKESPFPLKKGILFIFQCLPLFLPSSFLPLFHSLFLCLSLSLSLLFFLPSLFFFLPSLFFWFYFASLFLSPCLFALYLCFCFMKEQHQNTKLESVFSSILSVSLDSCLVLSFKSLFLVLMFPYLKSCVCSTTMFLSFQKDNL